MATIAKNTRVNEFTLGSDSAGPFNVGFRLLTTDGLAVYVDGALTAAYTLSATFVDGYDDAATITFDAVQTSGAVVRIDGKIIPERADDYLPSDRNMADKINIELAVQAAIDAEVRRDANRSVKVAGLDAAPILLADAKGGFIKFNATTGQPEAISEIEASDLSYPTGFVFPASTVPAAVAVGDTMFYATTASMTAAPDLTVGTYVGVHDGYNGQPSTYLIVSAGTYTANADTVIDLTGISGQAVDLRTWFKTFAELEADTRPAVFFDGTPATAVDTQLTAAKIKYDAALSGATDHSVTTAGGLKLYVSDTNKQVPPRAFFAPTDGTDGGPELQKWLDWLGDTPGSTGLIEGPYSTAQDLYIKKPVIIKTLMWGEVRSTVGSYPSGPCSLIALTGVTDLLTVKADTPGDLISGCRLELYLEGENIAERGLVMSTVDWCFVDAFVERCTRFGLDIDDANGEKSAFVNISRYFYTAGSNAACALSTGIRMSSVDASAGSAASCTNFWLGEIWTSVQEVEITAVANLSGDARFSTFPEDHNFNIGDEVWIYRAAKVSDSSTVYSYQCDRGTIASIPATHQFTVTGNAGTVIAYDVNATGRVAGGVGVWIGDIDNTIITKSHGSSIYFGRDDRLETPPIREARKNQIVQCGGELLVGDGSLNYVNYVNAEPSGISILTNSSGARGDGTLGGVIQDRGTGQQWKLREYKTQDSHFLEATAAYVSGTAAHSAIAGLLQPSVDMPDTTTSTATWGFRVPRDWADGAITNVILYYSGPNDGLNTIDITVRLDQQAEGDGQGAYDTTATASISTPATANDMTKHTIPIPWPITEGDFVTVQVERDGATDSCTQAFRLVGVEVQYDATGPADNIWQWPDSKTA